MFKPLFILITVVIVALGSFQLFIKSMFVVNSGIPDFYVTTYEEFLDATKNDEFITPDLDKYDLSSFGYWIEKESRFAKGKSAYYGRHSGYRINGRVIPTSSFDELNIRAYSHESRYNKSNPKSEIIGNTSYKEIDIYVDTGKAITNEVVNRYDKEWQAGSLSYLGSCRFDLNNYRYYISSQAMLAPGEFTDVEQVLEDAKAELMELGFIR